MTILFERDGAIASIVLNRPEKRNALLPEAWGQLADILDEIENDEELSAVVLSGAGGSFCAGADFSMIGPQSLEVMHRQLDRIHRVLLRLYNFEKPVIAAVDGSAVGVGWSLALCCDLAVVSDRVRFSQIFLKRGLVPDGGSVNLLRAAIGTPRAKEIAYSARFVEAEEALRLGLAVAVVKPEALLDEAGALARRICEHPPFALAVTKRLFNGDASTLEEYMRQELLAVPSITQSDEFKSRTSR